MVGIADVRQGLGIVSKVLNSQFVQVPISYAGVPIHGIGADIKKTRGNDSEKHKEEAKGVVYWIREKLLTYGNALAVLLFGGSIACNKVYAANPEQNSKLGSLGGMLRFLSFISVGSSIYSSCQGLFVKAICGRKNWIKYQGELPDMLKDPNEELAKKYKSTAHMLRYNNGRNGAIDEAADVERLKRQIRAGEQIRALLLGGSGTGKTHTMYVLKNLVEDHEATKSLKAGEQRREVLVKEVNGSKLTAGISDKGFVGKAIEFAKELDPNAAQVAQVAEQSLSLLRGDNLAVLDVTIDNILLQAEVAHKSNKRFLVMLDEIDKIWGLAKENGRINPDAIGPIAIQFQKLLESPHIDLILTGNGTIDDMCGKAVLGLQESDPFPPEIVGLRRRLVELKINMTEPKFGTQAEIIAANLIEVQKSTGKSLEDLFDQEIVNSVNDLLQNSGFASGENDEKRYELALAEVVYNKLYKDSGLDKFTESDFERPDFRLQTEPLEFVQASVFRELNGAFINKAVMERYSSDLKGGCAKGSDASKVTIDGLNHYLEQILEEKFKSAREKYKQPIQAYELETRKEGRKREQIEGKLTELREIEDGAYIKLYTTYDQIRCDVNKRREIAQSAPKRETFNRIKDLLSENSLLSKPIERLEEEATELLVEYGAVFETDETRQPKNLQETEDLEEVRKLRTGYDTLVAKLEAVSQNGSQIAGDTFDRVTGAATAVADFLGDPEAVLKLANRDNEMSSLKQRCINLNLQLTAALSLLPKPAH